MDSQYFCQEITTFWRGWQLLKPRGAEILEWWDQGKAKIKEIAIQVSKQKAHLRNQVRTTLMDNYKEKLQIYDRDPNTRNAEILKEAKQRVEHFEKEKTKGLRIRSRVQWYEKGERSDKYFLNLERYRGKQKTFTKIRQEDGKTTEDINEILETQRLFYKKLYTESNTDEKTQQLFLDSLDKQLDNTAMDSCEGLISPEEAKKAVKSLADNKSPGSDGLSKEFFDRFWNLLGNDLIEVFNTAYVANKLSDTQRTAIITLLYKSGEKEDIRNWRPISLLNVDFKILAKCLANRLKKCIGKLVHPDQTCGIKGRTIFENIIVAQDAIFISNSDNRPLAIIAVDQTKAFDRLNRSFMFKTLKKFGFGDSFTNWIKILYNHIESKICTNGYLSQPFGLERGVRQGCPLSPMLYTLTSETLLCAIRRNPNIRGFSGPENLEIKVKGYADDTAIYVRDIESVQTTIDLVDRFGQASESKINIGKTKVLLCGPLKREKPGNSLINYVTDKIKVLGVWVGNVDTTEANWLPIVNKISKLLRLWSIRDLTIMGKSTVVNTLAMSKVWHLASVSVPPDQICDQIQEAVHKFMRTRKTRLVQQEIINMPKKYGGINCIDIKTKAKALKIKWLLKIISDRNLCNSLELGKFFLKNFDRTFKGLRVISTNLRNMRNQDIPIFYQDMVTTWQALKLDRKISSPRDALLEFIFANPIFTRIGQTLYYLNFMNHGITRVKDIWRTDRFASLDEIMRSHNIPETRKGRMVVEYQNLTQAIPNQVLQLIHGVDGGQVQESNYLVVQDMYHVNKELLKSKNIYERLLYLKSRGFEQGFKVFVNAEVQEENNLEKLEKWWSRLYRSELDNKAKEFQWQISHKALYTLTHLNEIDPEISKLCVMCKDVEETLEHVFTQCVINQMFWVWLFREFRFNIDLDKKFIYLNSFTNTTPMQFNILCVGKMAIWETRNILRNTQLQNILGCLKLNFRCKMQSFLTTLYHSSKDKGQPLDFKTKCAGIQPDKIVIINDKIMLNLTM